MFTCWCQWCEKCRHIWLLNHLNYRISSHLNFSWILLSHRLNWWILTKNASKTSHFHFRSSSCQLKSRRCISQRSRFIFCNDHLSQLEHSDVYFAVLGEHSTFNHSLFSVSKSKMQGHCSLMWSLRRPIFLLCGRSCRDQWLMIVIAIVMHNRHIILLFCCLGSGCRNRLGRSTGSCSCQCSW